MKAAVYERYGPPEVVSIREVERPEPAPGQVLVAVRATSVTTADWRMRAAAFPDGLWLLGRLMTGLFAPRNRILGGEFAGIVAATGEGATRFRPGEAVFGFSGTFGAHAEYLAIPETGAIAPKPENIDFGEAAIVPFGALCALVFLRDFGGVEAGQQVLIAGASGGVGAYAVQIARHLGAEVTAVSSAANHELVHLLGADHVIDYRTQDFTEGGARFDVVFDTAGTTGFARARQALKPAGVFLPLEFGIREALQVLASRFSGDRRRMLLRVSGDTREDIETIAALIGEGRLRPVVDSRFALGDIADAYRRVEGRHKTGGVVVEMA